MSDSGKIEAARAAVPPAAPARAPREQVRERVEGLKKSLVAGALFAFVGLFALVTQHVVGVTAHQSSPQAPNQPTAPQVQAPNPGGFFGNSGGNSNGGSPSLGASGSAPVFGSGGS